MIKKRLPFTFFRLSFSLSPGFSLAELLIITSVIALLVIAGIIGWQKQIDRGYDAKRKSDLKNIQNAFDDYYNDKNCYPTVAVLSNCGGTDLAPYIAEVPCDPHTHKPYVYRPLSVDGGQDCSGYRVLTTLKDKQDLDIARVGCNAEWCGFTDVPVGYNYGVSMGVQVPKDGFDPGTQAPTPTPTPPSGIPRPWACTAGGDCNNFGWPNSCPVNFTDDETASGYCQTTCQGYMNNGQSQYLCN